MGTDGRLEAFLGAADRLVAGYECRLTERSVLTLTLRPGLVVLTESGIDDAYRPLLVVGAVSGLGGGVHGVR